MVVSQVFLAASRLPFSFTIFTKIILVHKCLLSTAYFPPVSWMAALLAFEKIEIETAETYHKQTYRNRCHIAAASGMLRLTVPVIKVDGNHTRTGNILLDKSQPWQLNHWRTIETAYSKTPYFLYYRDAIQPLFSSRIDLLIDLNHEIVLTLSKLLKFRTPDIAFTQEFITESTYPDFRNSIHPKSGIINTTEFPRYMQAFEERTGFLPDLSVVDLIFNTGPDAPAYLHKISTLIFSRTE